MKPDIAKTLAATLFSFLRSFPRLSILLPIWTGCFLFESMTSAQNEAFGYVQSGTNTYEVNLNSSAVAGVFARLSVPYVWADARTAYGFNQAEMRFSIPTDQDGQVLEEGSSSIESRWTDRFTITGGSGTNVAIFTFRGDAAGVGVFTAAAMVSSPAVNPSVWQNYYAGDLAGGAKVSLYVEFVYGRPFTVRSSVYLGHSVGIILGGYHHANTRVQLQLTRISVPSGATITSGNGGSYSASSPDLTLAPSGSPTNVTLHWFGYNDQSLQSTTNLQDSLSWTDVEAAPETYDNQVETEYSLALPIDARARFFRLRRVTP